VRARFDNDHWNLLLTLQHGTTVKVEFRDLPVTTDLVKRESAISDYLRPDYDLDAVEWDFGVNRAGSPCRYLAGNYRFPGRAEAGDENRK
jgi:hypothetical protein